MQAMESIKLITGIGEPLLGRLWTYDALAASNAQISFQPNPDCPHCGPGAKVGPLEQADYDQLICETNSTEDLMTHSDYPLEISVTEAKALLEDSTRPTRLIDVREPHEFEICNIAGADLIPMRQIPENVPTLPKNEHLLIHCHHGGRSMRVVQYLRDQGFEAVTNVGGGIDAWAIDIDSSIQRY